MPNLCLARIAIALTLLALPLAAPAQGDLTKTLTQMDQASAKFQSAQADFRKDTYERVARDTTTQRGTVYFLRASGGLQMGLKVTDSGAEKIVQYRDGILDVFSPGVNQIDRFKSAQAEGYLAIGFGGSGRDLAKSWTITDQGIEPITVDGKSIATEKLDLVSKDPNIRNQISHITIWVDLARDISLKQQFFQPSGDTQTSIYSNIRYNQKVNTAPYAIKKGATVIPH